MRRRLTALAIAIALMAAACNHHGVDTTPSDLPALPTEAQMDAWSQPDWDQMFEDLAEAEQNATGPDDDALSIYRRTADDVYAAWWLAEYGDEAADQAKDDEEALIGPSVTLPTGLPGVTITKITYVFNSHHFTLEVDGDGEALTQLENLAWYQAIINVETSTGAFWLDATFNTNGFQGRLFGNDGIVSEAVIAGRWTDPSTLVIDLEHPDYDTAATSVVADIIMRLENEDGTRDDYESSASWSG